MIQKHCYNGESGGFVIHKATGDFKGKASLYFDKNKKLIEAEQIFPNGKSRSIAKNKSLWNDLEQKYYNK